MSRGVLLLGGRRDARRGGWDGAERCRCVECAREWAVDVLLMGWE
jgi:hypothetical protein